MIRRLCIVALALIAQAAWSAETAGAEGWITYPGTPHTPVVLEFRRLVSFDEKPASLPVRVTADQRFVLYVNGLRVASGPSRGTVHAWREAAIDLAPWLRAGSNEIDATVWSFGDYAPLAQQTVATGFRLIGAHVSTAEPGWQVTEVRARSVLDVKTQIPNQYYVASTPEKYDPASFAPESGDDWHAAVPAPAAAARTLVADPLPQQMFAPAEAGRVVRSSLPGGDVFPMKPVTVPARTSARLLLRRDAMISAYPELSVSGGKGATVELHYSEALYDAAGKKGDRDLVDDRRIGGFHDEFVPDGRECSFAPLWWRTFRYLEIAVTTGEEPLKLRGLTLHETGYPFEQVGRFESNDAGLDRIFDIGWRTLRVDAHETFMDSSFWEQLQYAGDTRLEMLVSYAVSGDARLARQAIDAFAESDVEGGLVQGAYPSRGDNFIATFSFAWVGMLADWSMQQPDTALLEKHLPRMRRALEWFEPLRGPHGLLGKNPQWNFIDWAGQRWDDRDRFPSWGRDNGSCLTTAMWVGALRQGAALEDAHGDAAHAVKYRANADAARAAIREHCWDAKRGLFADDTTHEVFSQHMNVFAVLYDIATPEEMPALLERITVRGHGIDAPPGLYQSTWYFAWYLVRAFEHAGLADRYVDLLQSWRDLLPLHFTTWPESRGDTRSDTHAWSAHPTADLLGLVAGIRPGAPGYARVAVVPVLGPLTSLDASAATPHGTVRVRYSIASGKLGAVIDRPATLPGEFVWRGKSYPLAHTHTTLTLPAN